MIAFVKGTLEHVLDNSVIIDCGGVGYQILVTTATIGQLSNDGIIKVFTHMQVREDGVSLYGFLSLEELKAFNMLITVTGVGPKAAQAICSSLSPSQLMLAIITGDDAALTKAPGVGKKLAQRISLELKDKVKTYDAVTQTVSSGQQNLTLSSPERQDAIDALISLGYGRGDAMKAVMECATGGMNTEQIIKSSLRALNA